MGCASSAQPQPVPSQQSNNNTARNAVQTAPAIGNSMPLQEPQRWSSKRKISRQQLEGKREEFWHTCQATNVPAVWQQIRTVCEVMASGDLATASAICQAANIITPEGSLTRCYDQFGNLVRIFSVMHTCWRPPCCVSVVSHVFGVLIYVLFCFSCCWVCSMKYHIIVFVIPLI